MSHCATIPMYVNPLAFAAAAEMGVMLYDERGYNMHAVDRIVRHAVATGTLAGCAELDREDEAVAEAAYVDALPPIPYDSPLWDQDDVLFDAQMLADDCHPWPIPAIGDDDRIVPPDAVIVPPELEPFEWNDEPFPSDLAGALAAAGIKPIAGGSPEFTDEDHADYLAWLDEIESAPPDDQVEPARDLQPDRLEAVAAALYGSNPYA